MLDDIFEKHIDSIDSTRSKYHKKKKKKTLIYEKINHQIKIFRKGR